MNKSIKLFSSLALALTLAACGSAHHKQPESEKVSFAPAIDVAYNEVNQNINDNIGLYVRWGGQIISSEKVGDVTQLTVFNYPLSADGRPVLSPSENEFNGGRFIVEVSDYDEESTPRLLTVYGQVSGEKTLVNGPKTLTIPVITAVNSQEWNSENVRDQRGVAYYDLGYSTGHFNSFNRFGFRGFNRFNRVGFNRFNRFNRFSRFGFRKGGRFGHRNSFYRGRRY